MSRRLFWLATLTCCTVCQSHFCIVRYLFRVVQCFLPRFSSWMASPGAIHGCRCCYVLITLSVTTHLHSQPSADKPCYRYDLVRGANAINDSLSTVQRESPAKAESAFLYACLSGGNRVFRQRSSFQFERLS